MIPERKYASGPRSAPHLRNVSSAYPEKMGLTYSGFAGK